MKINKTFIEDLLIIEPPLFKDDRGFFYESYNKKNFDKIINTAFVQDNESKSNKGVVRGLHFQLPPFEQTKLIRCVCGKILDVVVDLRKKSKTFGKYVSQIISQKDNFSFYIPDGFAHGFLCLSNECTVNYKCTSYRNAESERTLQWNDPNVSIKWPIKNPILSKKDKNGLDLDYFD